jgi:hypothetical protein
MFLRMLSARIGAHWQTRCLELRKAAGARTVAGAQASFPHAGPRWNHTVRTRFSSRCT